jgi:transcriptional regulator with XRE-family HTH domain
MSLGVRLKGLREERGMQATEIAKMLNIAKSTYSGYENDKSKPDYEILIKLAKHYSVSVDFLLGNTGNCDPVKFCVFQTTGDINEAAKGIYDELIVGSMDMFAKRLRKLRNEKTWTQCELAERMNFSGATIAMYETSKRSPDRETIIRLAKMFQVSVDYLLGESIVRNRTDTIAFNVTGNVTESAGERQEKQIIGNENIFGKQLKELRKVAGLTQKELAKLINATNANISKYETGRIEPNIETILFFADFFEVSTDYLLGMTDIRNYSDTRKSYLPGEVVEEMNELIHDLMKIRKATTTELFLACDCGEERELNAQEEMEFTDKLHEIQRLDGKIKLLKEMSQRKTEVDIEQLKKKRRPSA